MTIEWSEGTLTEQVQRDLARKEFAKWLQNVFGQAPQVVLGTYTFRPHDMILPLAPTSIGRQYVQRAGERLVSLLMENGSTCFVCVEVGSDTRRLHLHSLETNESRARKIIHSWWAKKYGHESSSLVNSREGVSLYVTKYVTKSDMPFWAGGPLYSTFREPIDISGGTARGWKPP